MNILQVKQYHNKIADPQHRKALKRWKESDNGYGYPVDSMFFFFRTDYKGYPTTKRKRGYVVYTENSAIFFLDINKANNYLKG